MKFFSNQSPIDSILSAFNTTATSISAMREVKAELTTEAELQAAIAAAAAAENTKVTIAEEVGE